MRRLVGGVSKPACESVAVGQQQARAETIGLDTSSLHQRTMQCRGRPEVKVVTSSLWGCGWGEVMSLFRYRQTKPTHRSVQVHPTHPQSHSRGQCRLTGEHVEQRVDRKHANPEGAGG